MQDFRKLEVWRRSHALTLLCYRLTRDFPRDETYGLRSQIRRASASIPTNIAEGCGRNGPAELARLLHIALGSASELDYLLLLAHDLEILNDDAYGSVERSVTDIKRMLAGLIRRVSSEN
ncbi:MAG: four helix bundle protein [Chloroflexota bacterium]